MGLSHLQLDPNTRRREGGGYRPVVEVGAVGELFAAQLAGLSDVSQAVDELRLHGVVLAELVEVLPRLAAPVGAELLTHVPAGEAGAGGGVTPVTCFLSPPPAASYLQSDVLALEQQCSLAQSILAGWGVSSSGGEGGCALPRKHCHMGS